MDENQKICAEYHIDKHIVKMPLETAQMLCTALLFHGQEAKYKAVHKKHPCTLWAATTRTNFMWLAVLGLELCREFSFRYEKEHSCKKVIEDCAEKAKAIPEGQLTAFAQAMPVEYKRHSAVEAYREYYIGAKHGFASWKKRNIPFWWRAQDDELRHE